METHFAGPVSGYEVYAGYQPTIYYSSAFGTLSFSAFALGSLRACPILLHRTVRADRIAFETTSTSAADASCVVRLGIYTNLVDGMRPDRLLLEAGTFPVPSGTSASAKEIAINLTLRPGLYWLASVNQANTGTAPPIRCFTALDYIVLPTSTIGASVNVGYAIGAVTGALPAFFTAAAAATAVGRIYLRIG